MDSNNRFTTRRGKGVLIFRQSKKLKGQVHVSKDWTRRVTVAGRTYYFNLGSDRAAAATAADELDGYLRLPDSDINLALGRWDRRRKNPVEVSSQEYPTIGDILAIHQASERTLDLDPKVAKGYRTALRLLIRYAVAQRKGVEIPVYRGKRQGTYPEDGLSADILTGGLVEDAKTKFLAAHHGDAAAMGRAKRSFNSVLRHARSTFSATAMPLYAGMRLPDLSSFLDAPTFRRANNLRYSLPLAQRIEKVFSLLPDLKEKDPEAWKVAMLALHAGARRKEIAAARKSWLKDDGLHIQAESDFVPKGRDERVAGMQRWAIKELRKASGKRYILEGTQTERYVHTCKRLIRWLAECGFSEENERSLHSLRKLYGSYVASTQSLFVAQRWLGHKTAQITADTYADAMLGDELKAFWAAQQETECANHALV